MLEPAIIKAYNKHRRHTDKSKICHAPFTSLNFEQNGNVTACCFNRTDVLGKYPLQSIQEIWNGAALKFMREKINENDLDGGCKLCKNLLESGNYRGTKAIYYDEYGYKSPIEKAKNLFAETTLMPKVFEFEISNTCNLSCTMCNGYYSSTIRKNREHLPLLENPYNEKFVAQVAEFIPQLSDLKFLGGEPFLIDIYYQIWEQIALLNPDARVHITTNGMVFNERVKLLLSKLKTGIIISIDSLNEERFESIRVGAKLSRVLENFESFRKITEEKKTYLSISCCAMANNWMDWANLVRFANKKSVSIHFNVVWNPGYLSLKYLETEKLEEIDQFLSQQTFSANNDLEKKNVNAFYELIQTIRHWKNESLVQKKIHLDTNEIVALSYPELAKEIGEDFRYIAQIILSHYAQEKPDIKGLLESEIALIPSGKGLLRQQLFEIWEQKGSYALAEMYFGVLPYLGQLFFGKASFKALEDKSNAVKNYFFTIKNQEAMLNDLIEDMERKSIGHALSLFKTREAAEIIEHMKSVYQ